jgi:uncharacterized protein YndB with AHSA1/START domain/predicted enzyme related to lactoylglutathione lyase
MTMANPVMHFELMATGDLDALRRFYAEAFGWAIDANNPMNYGLVDTGGPGINGGIGAPMHGPGYSTIYVEVEDLQQKLDEIGRLGGKTLMPPMPIPGQPLSIAMFHDPAGLTIGLMQRTGPAPKPEDLELAITQDIDAPRDLCFRTFTDPQSYDEWWGPHGMRTPVCEMDLRPGGVFRTVMRAPDGSEYDNQGVFLEVVPNERIVSTDAYTVGWKPTPEPFMTAITTFEDLPGGRTRMTSRVQHRNLTDRARHEKMGFHDGWGQSYARFAAAVLKRK